MSSIAIVWFRRDLRLMDNPALSFAVKHYSHIIPLYIWDDYLPMGAASRWWLHHSLKSLEADLAVHGCKFIIQKGASTEVLLSVAQEHRADAVFWNRLYDPASIKRDTLIKKALQEKGTAVESFNASLLNEPWSILKPDQQPYKVFTAYWKSSITKTQSLLVSVPKKINGFPVSNTLSIDKLNLLPKKGWDKLFYNYWDVGEKKAHEKLNYFCKSGVKQYQSQRDIPSLSSTSALSAHLVFGEISPHRIYHHAKKQLGSEPYIRQLYWRDFAYYLLYHYPYTATQPLDQKFKDFPWIKSVKFLRAWQTGKTGVPIVDAGMRQLWKTGWMHNRVRMIVASFLCKNLRIDWRSGADWFWDTLVDADLANNTMGWQWVAGCGADAAPYFRIFNPVLQSEKFDPKGLYIKQWVPELTSLPDKFIHAPWKAPSETLTQAGLTLGKDYPLPCVDLSSSRQAALDAYHHLKAR